MTVLPEPAGAPADGVIRTAHDSAPAAASGDAAGTTAQRRYLVLLFADLCDSTQLGAQMEAEHYAEMLAAVRGVYQRVIGRHGGTVVRIQGDGVLAIFGHPASGEDDGRRAVQAALDLHAEVGGLPEALREPGTPALALHTGVHSGLVLVDAGDLERGRFELLGNAPNVAARLCEAAGRDEILVSEATLGPETHFFLTGGRRRLSFKGRDAPMAVVAVHGRAQVHTRFEASSRRGLAPLVGRQREFDVLAGGLHAALEGTRTVAMTITAAAGVGKTRLAEEVLRHALTLGFEVHRGWCESHLSAEPMQPFLQMLRALFGVDRGLPPSEAAAALGRGLEEIDPRLAVHRGELLRALSIGDEAPARPRVPTEGGAATAAAALGDLFDALAAGSPRVVFVDDVQWADDATRQVLAALDGLVGRRLYVLVTTRDAAAAAGDAAMTGARRVVALAPFDDREAAQAIARLLPHADPFVVAEIGRLAGGNPLYIEELCHAVATQDGAVRPPGRGLGGAAWLDKLVESRVARLPPAQAELVRAAAVVGNVVLAWLLACVAGCAEEDPLLHGLAEQDLLLPGESPGTLRFKHGLTHDAIYESVGLHRRRALHLRIAATLRSHLPAGGEEEICEALAYHYGAGDEPAAAARYAELAGDKAMAASALDRAQAQYRAALAALDRLPPSPEIDRRWSAIAERLGLVSVFDPSREPLAVLGHAAERAAARGDGPAIARAEYWLGYLHYALGDLRDAIRHCQRALDAGAAGSDDPLAVQVRATLGQAYAASCNYGQAMALLDEAIDVKRRHLGGGAASRRPAVGLSYSLTCKASVLGDRGDFDAAHECFAEALDVLRGIEHEVEGSLHCWRSAVFLWQGRWDEGRGAGRDAQRVGERVRSLYIFAMGRALAAYAEWRTSPSAESVQAMADATGWVEGRHHGQCISLNHGWLAEALADSGRADEARTAAAHALRRGRVCDRLGEPMACRALAGLAARRIGRAAVRPHTPEHYLALALRAAQARESRHEIAATRLSEAAIALGRGDRAAARVPLEAARAAFEAMRMPWHLAQADRLAREL